MPAAQDDHLVFGHLIDKPVREPFKRCPTNVFLDLGKTKREGRYGRDGSIDHLNEVRAEPGIPLAVPHGGFLDVGFGLRAEDDSSRHANRR
jgi:hypothetical protein